MKQVFRFLCVMTMLCNSLNGFSVSMNIGNSYTIIVPESYRSGNYNYALSDYSWEYDPSYFEVEFSAVHNPNGSSSGCNVAKVTIIAPFSGSKTIKCTAKYYTGSPATTLNTTSFSYSIACNPVNVILYPTETMMDVGESQNLQWMFNPQVSQYYVFALFSSNNPSVATVDLFGKVTAKGPGTATITATTNYGTTATCEVTVNPLLASSISLSQTSMNLAIGTTRALTDTILPIVASNKAVMWTSSNESIATVDADGKVTAISKGIANITATTTDGTNLSADCLITVFSEGDSSSTGGNTSDVNNDGSTDIDDVTSLIQLILGL